MDQITEMILAVLIGLISGTIFSYFAIIAPANARKRRNKLKYRTMDWWNL